MEELAVRQEALQAVLFGMSTELMDKYIIITNWETDFYLSHPHTDTFNKMRGRLYMSRTFLPSMIDFEDGWQILYTDNLEEVLEAFTGKFPNPY